MNDFDFDVLQKKRAATGAFHQKIGSKSTKCNLPSDNLTPKQLKALSGPVISVNLNGPISWKVFTSLSYDLQKDYVSNIVATYGCSKAKFEKVFGISRGAIDPYFRQNNNYGLNFSQGSKMTYAQETAFDIFLQGEAMAPTLPAPVEEDFTPPMETEPETPSAAKEEAPAPPKPPMQLRTFNLTFDGNLDPNSIANSLKFMLGENATGTLKIHFYTEKE